MLTTPKPRVFGAKKMKLFLVLHCTSLPRDFSQIEWFSTNLCHQTLVYCQNYYKRMSSFFPEFSRPKLNYNCCWKASFAQWDRMTANAAWTRKTTLTSICSTWKNLENSPTFSTIVSGQMVKVDQSLPLCIVQFSSCVRLFKHFSKTGATVLVAYYNKRGQFTQGWTSSRALYSNHHNHN